MRMPKQIGPGLGAILVLALLGGGRADEADPRVYPTTEKVGGKTYAEWAAAWWRWGLGAPKDKNPISDRTGKFADRGQSGPVWFLAGTFGGKATRTCSVPAGKALFFPVVIQGQGGPYETANEAAPRRMAKGVADTAYDLEVTIDGKPVQGVMNHRVATAVFPFNGPEKEEDAVIPNVVGKQKMVSDGYWVLLKPLAPGKHTLHFKGKLKRTRFSLDVTYQLTVLEAKRP